MNFNNKNNINNNNINIKISKNFDTNVDNYDYDELLNILELNNPSKKEIEKKINDLISNYFYDNFSIQQFFYSVQNKLLNYFNDNELALQEELFNTNDFIENMYNISDNESNYSDESNNSNELIENMENLNQRTNNENNENNENLNQRTNNDNNEINENLNQRTNNENNIDSYNIYDLVEVNNNNIENLSVYNYLHFNTLFRSKINTVITNPSQTNSNFLLSTPINNISQIKLASINIKKPFLISQEKQNNKFIIKRFVKNNTTFTSVCDFSYIITIEDGFYSDYQELVNYLNLTYFKNSNTNNLIFELSNIIYFSDYPANINNSDFLKNIEFSIDANSKKICFKLNSNYVYDGSTDYSNYSFDYFLVDFKSYYVPYYSLANILGFDINKSSTFYKSIKNDDDSYIIKSPYYLNNKNNSELFFCFDEYQSNIIETHKLFLSNNMSTNKILAKINTSLGNKDNNFYIHEIFSSRSNRDDIIRKYDGLINLYNFNIKVIDYYGNIINSNLNEDFTFTLEVKILQTRLIN